MNYNLLKFFTLFWVIFFISTNNVYPQSTGLRFFGQEHRIDERTSLELFPESTFKTTNGFSIEFDLSLEKNYRNYNGYILRIVNQEGTNIDLGFFKRKITMNLIVENNNLSLAIPIKQKELHKYFNLNLKRPGKLKLKLNLLQPPIYLC